MRTLRAIQIVTLFNILVLSLMMAAGKLLRWLTALPFATSKMALSRIRRGIADTLAFAALATGLFAGAQSRQSTAQPRVRGPVDESALVSLKGNVRTLARDSRDIGPVSPSTPTGRIMIVLQRSAEQQQALTQYLSSLQNPASSSYHKWLTPAQFGQLYGPADADVQTLQGWLDSHGFKVEHVPQARNVIVVSGSMGQVESAFHTSIHSILVHRESHIANINDPQIPAALAPIVAGIAPLNDLRPRPDAAFAGTGRYSTSARSFRPSLTLFGQNNTPYLYVDPADAATIYDTPDAALNPNYSGTTYDGTGINLGIVGDSNITMQDVTNYRTTFLGESASTANVPTVIIDGNDPMLNGDEAEALLDNEIAGGIAPKAKIYFYTSADSDLQSGLFNALYRALDDNVVSILNVSFSACEAGLGTGGNALVLEAMQQAAAQGISVTVATGDSGSAGCDDDNSESAAQNGLAVNGLASTPFTIAVGGTDFDVLASSFFPYVHTATSGSAPYYRTAQGYIPEEPWNNSTYPNTSISSNVAWIDSSGATNIVAAGGGASSVYMVGTTSLYNFKPSFQISLTPPDNARDLPDVSLFAANGFYGATWAICADNVANGDSTSTYTDCQTTGGQLTSSTSISGYGGTSTAAPAFAGMLALVEQKAGSRLGQADYVLYQLAQSQYGSIFHDVTAGDNSVVCASGTTNCGSNGFLTGYDAATNYDQASGLGSMDVAQMVNNWSSVTLGATTTAFNINGSTTQVTGVHGASLNFNVVVTPTAANVGGTPTAATGVVAIIANVDETTNGPLNNGQLAIPLTSGTGTVAYGGLPGGSYTVYARYGGDSSDAASNSSPISVDISPEASSTQLLVDAYSTQGVPIPNLSQIPYGSFVFADVMVYGSAGPAAKAVATGTVTFTDGSSALAQTALSSSNQAAYATPTSTFPAALSVGPHSLTAKYSGDPSYDASTSTSVPLTIVQAQTSLAATAKNASISSVASTTITTLLATASLGAYPTGTVTLSANNQTLATISHFSPTTGASGELLQSVASIQGSQLPLGANTITASYSGDVNYSGSSATVMISVTPALPSFTLSGPATALSAMAGASAPGTITVTPSGGFTGAVNLTCSVTTTPAAASHPATCAIVSPITISGNTPASSILTLSTSASTTVGTYGITVTGVDAATGTITANAAASASVIAVPNPAFALTDSGSITISSPGATTGNTSTIIVTPSGGFNGAVNLSCAVTSGVSSATDLPTCTLGTGGTDSTSVNITGNGAQNALLTVNTIASTSARTLPFKKGLLLPAGGAGLALVFFFGLSDRRRRWQTLVGLFAICTLITGAGCGGGSTNPAGKGGGNSSPGTTTGAYTVTISGTDAATGKMTQTVAVNVTIN